MRCCSEKPDQGKSTRMSSPDFCLRSLSEIPGRKVFYEGLLHLRSHHRVCGRTIYPTYTNSVPECRAYNNVPYDTNLVARGHMTSGYAFPLEIFSNHTSGGQK